MDEEPAMVDGRRCNDCEWNPLPPLCSSRIFEKVKKLLVQSKAAYLQAASALAESGGDNTDVSAISQGAPRAALICVASEAVFPEAIALVRYVQPVPIALLLYVVVEQGLLGWDRQNGWVGTDVESRYTCDGVVVRLTRWVCPLNSNR